MLSPINLPNPRIEPLLKLYEKELSRLKEPKALERQLTDIDKVRAFRRIYVMGCGRSGTWLLTRVMGTFKQTEVLLKELSFEYFGLITTSRPVLVLKRDGAAYQRIEKIPERIEIAYIVRHPFDVLTSHLPISQRPFHILPSRWLGEMTALQYLTETRRANTKIIRYEDLVTNPLQAQSDLASFFDLSVGLSIYELYTMSNNPSESPMHRARKLDTNSINKHKRASEKLEYLKKIRRELGQMLQWVGNAYHYDISL